jgi:hypothetical protein
MTGARTVRTDEARDVLNNEKNFSPQLPASYGFIDVQIFIICIE